MLLKLKFHWGRLVTISLNGDFQFGVARDIDHSSSETIIKQFSFLAEDGDGDTDTSTLELSITDGQKSGNQSDSTCYFIWNQSCWWLSSQVKCSKHNNVYLYFW